MFAQTSVCAIFLWGCRVDEIRVEVCTDTKLVTFTRKTEGFV